ncbi:MAG TPA: peptidogalycan biosysnthesis protein, partial [Ensifer sp.]|nr:peptidogalycan biosysnthesis protein [Ensifer sp.]
MTDLKRRIIETISSVPKADWDRLDGAGRGGRIPYNPFVSHAYLSALEDSGSAVSRAGWQPRHIALAGADGKIAAAL